MAADLSPKLAKTLFEGDGGSYQAWSSSDLPILRDAKVGAGKLVLKPLGFALPHYSDSAKVGYVLQGTGLAGLVLPKDPKEKVVRLQKGDFIVVPLGAVSWWYNNGDSDLSVLFMGDTSSAGSPGEFTYFFLTGSRGIFTGFSMEFVRRAWDLREDEAKRLFTSQPGFLIVKLEGKIHGLEPCDASAEGITLNCKDAAVDFNSGRAAVVTRANLPLLREVGFSAGLHELGPNAMLSPCFSPDPAVQLICVTRGSGHVQIVGANGDRILDTTVKEGGLFVVPKFFVMSVIADGEGMEWSSITTSPEPVIRYLAGKESLLKVLSTQILEASLNVAPDLVRLLGSTDAVFLPLPK